MPTPTDFKKLSLRYSAPQKVQALIRSLAYNRSNTMMSAATTLQNKTAHCLEAALLAAAILEHKGYPPLIVSLESQDLLDHVLFVFKTPRGWGAIGKSRDEGLHGRQPQFRNLKALVDSYFEPYVDKTGRLTGFALYDLRDCKLNWRQSPRNLWKLEKILNSIRHEKFKATPARYKKAKAAYLGGGHARRDYWW